MTELLQLVICHSRAVKKFQVLGEDISLWVIVLGNKTKVSTEAQRDADICGLAPFITLSVWKQRPPVAAR